MFTKTKYNKFKAGGISEGCKFRVPNSARRRIRSPESQNLKEPASPVDTNKLI